jgi:hypothetical protein
MAEEGVKEGANGCGAPRWSRLSVEAEYCVRGGWGSRASEVVAFFGEEVVAGGVVVNFGKKVEKWKSRRGEGGEVDEIEEEGRRWRSEEGEGIRWRTSIGGGESLK